MRIPLSVLEFFHLKFWVFSVNGEKNYFSVGFPLKCAGTPIYITTHAWSFDHRIDFDSSCVIDKGSFRVRKTLEAWHTSATKHADNNSKPIPDQYCILFKQ